MHRAKHRAVGRASAEVLATTLVERFAVVPTPRPARTGPRHSAVPVPVAAVATVSDRFVPAPVAAPRSVDGDSPFGAARHARRSLPAPAARVRPQPPGVTLSATVLGAAAAVSAVVVPSPTAVESTGSLAPVQNTLPGVPLGPTLAAPTPAAPAPLALPDEPTVQIDALVDGVTAQMQQVERPYTTVAAKTALSPAAVRRAAVTRALSKLGKPYRYGSAGPNAFDCSGLVKWSFANAGRSLPRTSRAMASAGVPVRKADLQPGDLVFFYKPISHVGIYIGNGKIVHASRKGQPVKVADMSRMKFTKAVRV